MCLRDVFVKLSFLGTILFEIRNKLQKMFTNKLMCYNLKIDLGLLLESKAFSPSRISYLRC